MILLSNFYLYINRIDQCSLLFLYNFFFQAEDGIRDLTVTGVQTCALPISTPAPSRWWPPSRSPAPWHRLRPPMAPLSPGRSEERRVGKECRSLWWPDHYKKRIL